MKYLYFFLDFSTVGFFDFFKKKILGKPRKCCDWGTIFYASTKNKTKPNGLFHM